MNNIGPPPPPKKKKNKLISELIHLKYDKI